jgi:hypothetical protein
MTEDFLERETEEGDVGSMAKSWKQRNKTDAGALRNAKRGNVKGGKRPRVRALSLSLTHSHTHTHTTSRGGSVRGCVLFPSVSVYLDWLVFWVWVRFRARKESAQTAPAAG